MSKKKYNSGVIEIVDFIVLECHPEELLFLEPKVKNRTVRLRKLLLQDFYHKFLNCSVEVAKIRVLEIFYHYREDLKKEKFLKQESGLNADDEVWRSEFFRYFSVLFQRENPGYDWLNCVLSCIKRIIVFMIEVFRLIGSYSWKNFKAYCSRQYQQKQAAKQRAQSSLPDRSRGL